MENFQNFLGVIKFVRIRQRGTQNSDAKIILKMILIQKFSQEITFLNILYSKQF